jgi:heme-degrading monooxygenase HmoA
MFVLHIELKVKPTLQRSFEQTYVEKFRPAISAQEGFNSVQLLRSNDFNTNYRLGIAFDHQNLQQKWVATNLHQEVWPAIAGHCEEFSVQSYSTV